MRNCQPYSRCSLCARLVYKRAISQVRESPPILLSKFPLVALTLKPTTLPLRSISTLSTCNTLPLLSPSSPSSLSVSISSTLSPDMRTDQANFLSQSPRHLQAPFPLSRKREELQLSRTLVESPRKTPKTWKQESAEDECASKSGRPDLQVNIVPLSGSVIYLVSRSLCLSPFIPPPTSFFSLPTHTRVLLDRPPY